MNRQNSTRNMTRRDILKYGLYGGVASLLLPGLRPVWCSEQAKQKGPNIILISIDTVRKDHCSVYGYERDTTPNLRRLAEGGARFDLAYSACSSTAPSHASMFTSLYPMSHKVLRNGYELTRKHYTLAEHLGSIGYQTAGVVASFVLDEKFGFSQGFKFYDDDFKPSAASIHKEYFPGQPDTIDQRATATTRKVINWLEKHRDPGRPFFMFIHYFDPHAPYVPPEPFRSKFPYQEPGYLEKLKFKLRGKGPANLEQIISLYDGELAYTDIEIGKVFDKLKRMGLEENTLVVVTSDHGEGLGQHNLIGHSINIYEEAVRVPLIFRWPKRIPRGHVINEPAEGVDIVPTIFDLIGIKPDDFPFHGQSLAGAIRGESSLEKDRPVYLYREYYKGRHRGINKRELFQGEKFAIRRGRWKYIEGKKERTKELFDLSSDPLELENLNDKLPDKASELTSQLEEWKQKYTGRGPVQEDISEEDRERLKALGYIN